MTNLPRPPAHIAIYVDVLGPDCAVEFLLTFGGAELYLATHPTARSRLVKLIGPDRARKLAAFADRLPTRVPTAKPWVAAVFRARGLPVAEIARRLHTSDVTVRRWLNPVSRSDPPPDPRQPRLF